MKKWSDILTISIFSIVFVCVLVVINFFSVSGFLQTANFLHWDAEHYNWIRNNGYFGFRVAFFPLFPVIWKVLSIGIGGIMLFNSLIYFSSLIFLKRFFNFSIQQLLFFLTIPIAFFYYLPYTESVFFASSTIMLVGIKSKNQQMIYIGLLLCTLARPAFSILIPAIILAEILTEKFNFKILIRLITYVLIAFAGILLVAIYQHYYTGEWFKFFDAQKDWGNEIGFPKLPLTSWSGSTIVKLDGVAFLFGTIAGIVLMLKIFKNKILSSISIPKEVIFSLAYLAGISLLILLIRCGSLFSLNRFIFATPFIIVVFHFYFNLDFKFSTIQISIIFLCVFLFWLLFGSYGHLRTMIQFFILSLFLLLFVLIKSQKQLVGQISWYSMIAINLILQFYFIIRFLNNGWVG